MTKKVITGPDVQQKLLQGVDTIADAVSATLGPLGRNAIIETPYGATTVTKDGVTVAKVIDLEDPIENMAAQIVKQAASRTAKVAGDGTTTATLLTQALIRQASRLMSASTPPIEIKRAYETMLSKVVSYLESTSKPVTLDNIGDIATISANNDTSLGRLISDAYTHVSTSGIITLEDSKTTSTDIELLDGASFDRGYLSHYFVTDPSTLSTTLDSPFFLITDYKIRSTEQLVPIMERVAPTGRPLVIIADEVEGEPLQLLVLNKLRSRFSSVAIKAPSFAASRAEILQDLAALTSADFISQSKAHRLEDTTLEQLGEAEKIIVTDSRTTIIAPLKNTPLVSSRVEAIHTQLKDESLSEFDTSKLQSRLANLTTKVAVIRVGAATETELKEKKDRIDDALKATRAAVQKGYSTGGGIALLRAAIDIPHTSEIEKAYLHALHAPFDKIMSNASLTPEVVKSKVLQSDSPTFGYNARHSTYEDLPSHGVIDPTLVLIEALKNATSAANMLMLSSTAIYAADRTPPYNPHNEHQL